MKGVPRMRNNFGVDEIIIIVVKQKLTYNTFIYNTGFCEEITMRSHIRNTSYNRKT